MSETPLEALTETPLRVAPPVVMAALWPSIVSPSIVSPSIVTPLPTISRLT